MGSASGRRNARFLYKKQNAPALVTRQGCPETDLAAVHLISNHSMRKSRFSASDRELRAVPMQAGSGKRGKFVEHGHHWFSKWQSQILVAPDIPELK